MISFITPAALPIEAATTMGVSVKESDNAIGKFGTGLKYAIAGVLRLGGKVEISIDGDSFEFVAKEADIRGRSFRIVHCNGQPCGFTTDLGKHWEAWQLFRELASNALDEGGRWENGSAPNSAGRTVIRVECREVEDSERNEQVFLGTRQCLLDSTMGAQVFEGANPHYYFNGIRAGSFGGTAPVTVNIKHGTLSEDRLLDLSVVQIELAWAFRSATTWDQGLMLSVLPQSEPGSFWIENVNSYTLRNAELPSSLMDFLAERPKFIRHPAFSQVLDAHVRKGGKAKWQEVQATPRQQALLSEGEALCAAVGIDAIPRDKVHFTTDLHDTQLAVTCMDTRHVWFSTKLAMLGRDEFLSGYLEEAMHAMTGLRDCTREFQNALMAVIVSNFSQQMRVAA